MALNNTQAGEGYAPAYQISATPWVTSSVVAQGEIKELVFPQVTRFINVQNKGDASNVIALGFTRLGLRPANANFLLLSSSQSFVADLRVDRLFISGVTANSQFAVVAGLTYIPPKNFLTVTGSNGHQNVG